MTHSTQKFGTTVQSNVSTENHATQASRAGRRPNRSLAVPTPTAPMATPTSPTVDSTEPSLPVRSQSADRVGRIAPSTTRS
jgi:hypothetical protein